MERLSSSAVPTAAERAPRSDGGNVWAPRSEGGNVWAGGGQEVMTDWVGVVSPATVRSRWRRRGGVTERGQELVGVTCSGMVSEKASCVDTAASCVH